MEEFWFQFCQIPCLLPLVSWLNQLLKWSPLVFLSYQIQSKHSNIFQTYKQNWIDKLAKFQPWFHKFYTCIYRILSKKSILEVCKYNLVNILEKGQNLLVFCSPVSEYVLNRVKKKTHLAFTSSQPHWQYWSFQKYTNLWGKVINN